MDRTEPTRDWLSQNQREMINCPYQPGNLIISKNACSKRHLVGLKDDRKDLPKEDQFYIRFKKGLSLCRQCPIGKKLAVTWPSS